MATKTLKPTDHYTIISADCHAGGSHAQYREYLDPAYLDDFDAWRNKYKNPFRDLPRHRASASATGTTSAAGTTRSTTASSARSSSRTPCRRSSRASCCSRAPPTPEEYEHRLAGIRAHNRWLVDFCAEYPERARRHRPDLPQRRRRRDRRRRSWIKEHGLRGGILLPNVPPDVTGSKPLYDPVLRPALGGVRGPRDRRERHGGTGIPDYGVATGRATLLYITEIGFYSQRPFVQHDPRRACSSASRT